MTMYIHKYTALLIVVIIVSLGFVVGWYDCMLRRSQDDLRWHMVTSEAHIAILSRIEHQQRESIAIHDRRIHELEQQLQLARQGNE